MKTIAPGICDKSWIFGSVIQKDTRTFVLSEDVGLVVDVEQSFNMISSLNSPVFLYVLRTMVLCAQRFTNVIGIVEQSPRLGRIFQTYHSEEFELSLLSNQQ
jgi:hypothetical protein